MIETHSTTLPETSDTPRSLLSKLLTTFGPWGQSVAAVRVAGDSIVNGAATTAALRWSSTIAATLGATETNLAFSGAVVSDLAFQILPGYAHTNSLDSVAYTSPDSTPTSGHWFLKVGVNDGADFPTSSGSHADYLTHYEAAWRAVLTYCATPEKVIGADMTQSSGTWSDLTTGPTDGFGGGVAVVSENVGDSLTFEVWGNSVFIGFMVSKSGTSSMGAFTVTVDGTVVDTVDCAGIGFGNRNDYSGPFAYIPFTVTDSLHCRRYSDLGARRHTVVITTTTASAGAPVQIVFGAGSAQPIDRNGGPYVWALLNVDRAADSVRDATYAALRAKVAQVVQELGADIGNVGLINPNSVYDTSTEMDADGIHPTAAGHASIAAAVLSAMAAGRGRPLPASASTASAPAAVSAPLSLTQGTSGVATVKATQSGSAFGFQAEGNGFGFINRHAGGEPAYYFNRANGTLAAPTAVTSGQSLGRVLWAPRDNSTWGSGAYLAALATENHSTTAHGTKLVAYTVPAGSTTPTLAMTVNSDGSLTMAAGATLAGALSITTTSTNITASGDAQFGLLLNRDNATASSAKEIGFQRKVSGGAVTSGAVIGQIRAYPHNGTTYPGHTAALQFVATENHGGAALGSKTIFRATPTGSTTTADALYVDGDDSSTQTALVVRFNGSMKRVEVGAADSGGAGYRLLRITN